MTIQRPTVSIIIPFYGDSLSPLIKCLKAIQVQTYANDKLETIIIDNNKIAVLNHDIALLYRARIFHEPLTGSYSARNKGIEVAEGEILTFTDSDCLPDKNWIEEGMLTLKDCDYACAVGGRIIFTFKTNRPNIFEFIDSTIHLRQEDYIANMNYAATANLFVPQNIFSKVGGFDSEYYAGGDREWGEKLKRNSITTIYSSKAIVYHPARSTMASLIIKNRRAVGGEVLRFRKAGYGIFRIFTEQKNAYAKRRRLLSNNAIDRKTLCLSQILLFIVYFTRVLEVICLSLGGKMKS